MKQMILRQRLLNAAIIVSLFCFLISASTSQAAIPETTVNNFSSVQGFGQASYAASDGSVYLGGLTNGAGGSSMVGSLIIDANSVGQPITPIPGANNIYTSVSDGSGGWYVGGNFDQILSAQRNNIAHILSDGTLDLTFNSDINDTVNALFYDSTNNLLYLGGNFDTVNQNTTPTLRNNIAAVNGTSGVVTSFDPDIDGTVMNIDMDTDNNIVYVSGSFLTVNSNTSPVSRDGIAGFNATTGTATSFDPGIVGYSEKIKFNPDTDILYVIGVFDTVNTNTSPVTRNKVAAFNTTTSVTTSFNPDIATTSNSSILTIELDEENNTVYLGGIFSQVNTNTTPTQRNNIASFDATTGSVTNFNPDIYFSDIKDSIETIALNKQTDTLYVAGDFYRVNHSTNPVSRSNSAAFNISTSIATNFNPNISGLIENLNIDDATGKLSVQGKIYGYGGTTRNNVTHILSDGTLDLAFNPDLDGMVTAFAIDESTNTIYVGGIFSTVNTTTNPTPRHALAALDLTTGAVKSFNAGINSSTTNDRTIGALAFDNTTNTLYVSGDFDFVNINTTPILRNGMAAFDGTTGAVKSFDPSINGEKYDIALDEANQLLYVSGSFNTVNTNTTPVVRNNIAAFNVSTSLATNFNPDINGDTFGIDLNNDNSVIYVSGDFSSVNNNTTPLVRNNGAAFNTNTSVATNFDPDLNAFTLGIEYNSTDNTVFIGGTFNSVNVNTSPLARSGLAEFNSTTGVATSFQPTVGGIVYAFSIDETANRLYAAGLFFAPDFSSFNGALAVYGENFEPAVTTTTTTTTSMTTTTIVPTTSATAPTTKANPVFNLFNPAKGNANAGANKTSSNGLLSTTGTGSKTIALISLLAISFGFLVVILTKKKPKNSFSNDT